MNVIGLCNLKLNTQSINVYILYYPKKEYRDELYTYQIIGKQYLLYGILLIRGKEQKINSNMLDLRFILIIVLIICGNVNLTFGKKKKYSLQKL